MHGPGGIDTPAGEIGVGTGGGGYGIHIKWKLGGGAKMIDPDASSGGVIFADANPFPSVQKIEAKGMQNKRPVNPKDNLGSQGFYPSEGPNLSKWDLISYYDGESSFGGGFSGGTIIPGGGYTDPIHPGFAPKPPMPPDTSGRIMH